MKSKTDKLYWPIGMQIDGVVVYCTRSERCKCCSAWFTTKTCSTFFTWPWGVVYNIGRGSCDISYIYSPCHSWQSSAKRRFSVHQASHCHAQIMHFQGGSLVRTLAMNSISKAFSNFFSSAGFFSHALTASLCLPSTFAAHSLGCCNKARSFNNVMPNKYMAAECDASRARGAPDRLRPSSSRQWTPWGPSSHPCPVVATNVAPPGLAKASIIFGMPVLCSFFFISSEGSEPKCLVKTCTPFIPSVALVKT